jgi:HlyD family secretion protein
MSSNFVRVGFTSGVAVFLVGVIAWAQDRKAGVPSGPDAVDVFNVVEDRTVVVTCLPDGTRVEKGAVVCDLDATDLQDRLAAQELAVRGAEADVHATRIGREVAVMALNEFKQGVFRQELATTEREIKMTEAGLASAEDQVDWVRRMFEKGYVGMAEKVTNELTLKRARFALEEAQSKKQVLVDFTRERTLKSLTGAVEAARASELAKQATLERERSSQRRLTAQISHCRVQAPASGRIEYVARLGTGAVVHDGDVLIRVIVAGESNTRAK